jgi:hypothetical protein
VQQIAGLYEHLQDVIISAGLNLSNAETWELEDLITKYKDVFVTKSSKYRQTNRV